MQRGESRYREAAGTCIKASCNPQPQSESDLTRKASYTHEPFHLFARSGPTSLYVTGHPLKTASLKVHMMAFNAELLPG